MEIVTELLAQVAGDDARIEALCVGAFWTVVSSRRTGLAATCLDTDSRHTADPAPVPRAGGLMGQPARELAAWVTARESVSASLGLAALNSLLPPPPVSLVDARNAGELLLARGVGRRIGVVGYFPFIPALRAVAAEVLVFERQPGAEVRPAESAAVELRGCDVVCLTSSTLINDTVDELLAAARQAFVVLTGPSTPLHPLLFRHGVDALCGCVVTEPELVYRHISQGACFRQFKNQGLRLVTWLAEGEGASDER